MKITSDATLADFKFWSGAIGTAEELTAEEMETVEACLEDSEPEDGWTATAINDIFWFEPDFIAKCLGYDDWEALLKAHSGEDEDEGGGE